MKNGTIGSVLSFARECKGRLVLSVVFALVSVAGSLVPFYAGYQILRLFFDGNPTAIKVLLWFGVMLGGYAVKLEFYGLSTRSSHVSAYKILESIRLALAEKLVKLPLGSVQSQTAGSLKSIVVDRVETIELPIAHMIPEGVSNVVLPLAIFIYMITIDWRIALASLVCLPIGAAVYVFMMRNYNSQYDRYMKSSAHVNSVIIEYIEGIQVIKAFNTSSSSYKKYTDAVLKFRDFTLSWFKSTWGLMNLGNAILPSTLLGVLPVGVLLYLSGALTPAELTLAVVLSLCMVAPASWFTVAVNDYKSIQYAIADVNRILEMPALSEKKEPVSVCDYSIRLDNISFSYENADTDALHNLSLDIRQGSFTALVGPSGGGKSTLAKLIARFWDVKSGGILIGGVNIKDIPFSQLSDMISFVTQDNYLFDCSLLENIRMGKPSASDGEVMKAAAAAQCEEFISRLENGWATTAGEAGGKLSGGERQRIAIARAILKNAPIVILDEATAFTDPENEAQLQMSISVLTKGKTLLVIAHRLSTIKNADNIVVLCNGKIEAQGTQNELLTDCELYRKMWEYHIGAREWSATNNAAEVTANV